MTLEASRPYIVFTIAAFLMVTVGRLFQSFLPLQFGLILTELTVVLGVAVFYRAVEDEPRVRFRQFVRPSQPWVTWLLIVVTGVLIGLVANVVASVAVELVPSLRGNEEAYAAMLERLLRPDAWYLAVAGVLSVVVVAPFCEEYLFRGTILPGQLAHQHPAEAVLLNGILFGAIHFNVMALLSLAIVGAFFAHMTLYSRSLWPAVVAHASLNLANGVILPLVTLEYGDPTIRPDLGQLLVALALVAPVAVGLWWLIVRRMKRLFLA